MDEVIQQAARARTEARSDRERVVALTEELRQAHGHARGHTNSWAKRAFFSCLDKRAKYPSSASLASLRLH